VAKTLPRTSSTVDEVMRQMRALQGHDGDYRGSRTWGLIYNAGPEVDAMLHAAVDHTLKENALNPLVFPSLREMQRDIVAIAADLFNGGEDCGGAVTSGGTESIFMAVKTARDKARAERGVAKGRLVIPRTAHPAFIKAAHLLDMEWVHAPLREDLRMHAEDMAPLLDEETVLAVGSAPNYPFGMVDPIEEMAAIASERGIPFHVDACLGGFMLPFLERLGHPLPAWDFRVQGVTSMSADLHKYGYATKGASVVMYRPKANLRYQVFQFSDWPGGIYGTQAFQGTKPAPPIAAAWAVLHFLGEEGYVRLAAQTLEAARKLIDGVNAMPAAHVWGEPDMTVAAIGSRVHDIFAVGDILNQRGWHFDRQDGPPSLHMMASPTHVHNVDEFLADLRAALDSNAGSSTTAATYGDDVSATAKS
jgi:glutamate/tyrosine decarboxylase-like PLP-dependent enzyme